MEDRVHVSKFVQIQLDHITAAVSLVLHCLPMVQVAMTSMSVLQMEGWDHVSKIAQIQLVHTTAGVHLVIYCPPIVQVAMISMSVL